MNEHCSSQPGPDQVASNYLADFARNSQLSNTVNGSARWSSIKQRRNSGLDDTTVMARATFAP